MSKEMDLNSSLIQKDDAPDEKMKSIADLPCEVCIIRKFMFRYHPRINFDSKLNLEVIRKRC